MQVHSDASVPIFLHLFVLYNTQIKYCCCCTGKFHKFSEFIHSFLFTYPKASLVSTVRTRKFQKYTSHMHIYDEYSHCLFLVHCCVWLASASRKVNLLLVWILKYDIEICTFSRLVYVLRDYLHSQRKEREREQIFFTVKASFAEVAMKKVDVLQLFYG